MEKTFICVLLIIGFLLPTNWLGAEPEKRQTTNSKAEEGIWIQTTDSLTIAEIVSLEHAAKKSSGLAELKAGSTSGGVDVLGSLIIVGIILWSGVLTAKPSKKK